MEKINLIWRRRLTNLICHDNRAQKIWILYDYHSSGLILRHVKGYYKSFRLLAESYKFA